jgi:hypothetical protein
VLIFTVKTAGTWAQQAKKTYATDADDEGIMLRRDVGSHSPEDATLHSSRLESSTSLLWEPPIPYTFPFKVRLPYDTLSLQLGKLFCNNADSNNGCWRRMFLICTYSKYKYSIRRDVLGEGCGRISETLYSFPWYDKRRTTAVKCSGYYKYHMAATFKTPKLCKYNGCFVWNSVNRGYFLKSINNLPL